MQQPLALRKKLAGPACVPSPVHCHVAWAKCPPGRHSIATVCHCPVCAADSGRSRFKQLLEWCGQDFDGLVIFDESELPASPACPAWPGPRG